MKTKEILTFLIVALTIISIGYAGFIQIKPGIKKNGSDKVIDPFLYDTGRFNDIYGGLNPNSSVHHISESKLQDIKLKKMSGMLMYTIPIIIILILINSNIKDEEELVLEQKNNTSGNLTDEEEKRLSLLHIALKIPCLPEDAKYYYIKELEDNSFNLSDLINTEKAWFEKRTEDGIELGIKPENTPAAIMLLWTKEYRLQHKYS